MWPPPMDLFKLVRFGDTRSPSQPWPLPPLDLLVSGRTVQDWKAFSFELTSMHTYRTHFLMLLPSIPITGNEIHLLPETSTIVAMNFWVFLWFWKSFTHDHALILLPWDALCIQNGLWYHLALHNFWIMNVFGDTIILSLLIYYYAFGFSNLNSTCLVRSLI